ELLPGVEPPTDKTEVTTKHFTYSDKIRFVDGKPEKIGGFIEVEFDYGKTISGYVRSIYSQALNTYYYTMYGSNEHLYSSIGSRLENITPLVDVAVAIPDSLDTHYATLGNDPMASTDGSRQVTVTDSEADLFQ